jgi:hypothetical protein
MQINRDSNTYYAAKTKNLPSIDGIAEDLCWENATWDTLDQVWIGAAYSETDFKGRYKTVWDDSLLYLLLEITDDTLLDQYSNPLVQYWDDDCVEVFLDQDHSGGIHQYNHQAFAYHISPLMNAIDISPDEKAHYYNHHIKGAITSNKHDYTWELAIRVFGSDYSDSIANNKLVKLSANKMMGFSLAYCDNDTSAFRENFIGSVNTPGHFKNEGWIDANCFGNLVLCK